MMNDTWRTTLLERQRWMTFLLPFLVFMLVGALEPTPEKPGGGAIGLAIPYSYYPWLYAAKIALTAAAVVFVLPGYREFPLKLSPTAIVVGVVGGPLWIGLCLLDWEQLYLALIEHEEQKGFHNLVIRPADLRPILEHEEPRLYRLIADESVVQPGSFAAVAKLHDAVLSILR